MKETIELRLEGDPTVPAKPGDIIKAYRNKGSDYIKVMPGNPEASLEMHKPYVHIRTGGKVVGRTGESVTKGTNEWDTRHIPTPEWAKWRGAGTSRIEIS